MTLEKSKSIEAELQTLSCENEEKPGPPKSFCSKAKLIFSNITVEPILVCYVWPSVMSSLAMQNLNLEKACRVNLGYADDVCDALTLRNKTGYSDMEEQTVQKLVASMNAYKNVIQSVIPSLLLIFLGSWCDKHKRRKPPIILPIAGETLTVIGFLISVYFFHQLPVEFNCFCEAFPPAITGGWFAMFMGVFSYISAVTSVETRTLRIGAVNMFSNVSLTIGIALSGILYSKTGFYGVFGLSLAMYVVALVYGTFGVKEVGKEEEVESVETGRDKDDAMEEKEVMKKKKGFIREFFDWGHVRDTFKVAFKEGKRNRKKRICTIMVLVMVIIGPIHGE